MNLFGVTNKLGERKIKISCKDKKEQIEIGPQEKRLSIDKKEIKNENCRNNICYEDSNLYDKGMFTGNRNILTILNKRKQRMFAPCTMFWFSGK